MSQPIDATEPVRVGKQFKDKLKLVAELRSHKEGREVSMGDLLAAWAEPHIAKQIKEAVAFSIEKSKGLLKAS